MKASKIIVGTSLLFLSSISFGKEHHDAHEHGKANLDIAVDGTKIQMIFHAPAESIYGFEHEAKSKKDVSARDQAKNQLEANALELFQFEKSLGCKVTSIKVEPWVHEDQDDDKKSDSSKKELLSKSAKSKKTTHEHGEHGELHALYEFQCEKPVTGTKLVVTLTNSFQKLRSIAVQYISDKKQTGLTLTSKMNSVEL